MELIDATNRSNRIALTKQQIKLGKTNENKNRYFSDLNLSLAVVVSPETSKRKERNPKTPADLLACRGQGELYSFYVARKKTTSNKNLMLSVNMKIQASPVFKSLARTKSSQPTWNVVLAAT